MNIGENVRTYRRKYGLTQEKLADLSGLSINFISRLERTDSQNVSLKTLCKIADAFHISLSQLVGGINEPKRLTSVDRLTLELYHLPEEQATQLTQAFEIIIRQITTRQDSKDVI